MQGSFREDVWNNILTTTKSEPVLPCIIVLFLMYLRVAQYQNYDFDTIPARKNLDTRYWTDTTVKNLKYLEKRWIIVQLGLTMV